MRKHCSKICDTCGIGRPTRDYRRTKFNPDGLYTTCNFCNGSGERLPDSRYINNSGVCRVCGRGEADTEFGVDRSMKTGVSSICKDCKHARGKRSRGVNQETIKAKHAAKVQEIRLAVLLHYGGIPPMCACCGEAHLEFLAIDHIGGGGGKHRSEIGKPAGHKFACWLQKNGYPEGFRVLCHSCNHATKDGNPCVHVDLNWSKDVTGLSHGDLYRYNYRMERRMTILKHYGGDPPKCACCGESHIRLLSIDHINGGGYRHMKEARRPLVWLIFHDNFPPLYRILCMNCNLARGFYGRCPHKASTDQVETI